MKREFLVCHVTLVLCSVLVGFIHIWDKGTGKTAHISPIGLLQSITTFVTVACRKNEDIEKTTTFEVSNS